MDLTSFFEFSPGLNLYSVAYKALQPNARWVQGNQSYKGDQKESINKKHTSTHKKRKKGGR
jgi:hypothetical protein